MALMGIGTIMPGLIKEVASRYPPALPFQNQLAVLATICMTGLAPLFGFAVMHKLEGLPKRKPLLFRLVIGQRSVIAGMAVLMFLMPTIGYGAFLACLFAGFVGCAAFNGTIGILWPDIIAREIPAERRGALFGLRTGSGLVLALILLSFVPAITARYPFPINYGLLYVAATVLWFSTAITCSLQKEIPYAPEDLQVRENRREQLTELISIFRSDSGYRRFLVASGCAAFVGMASISLYVMKATQVLGVPENHLQIFTSRMAMAQMLGSACVIPITGLLADRIGYKRMACGGYTLLLASLCCVLVAQTHVLFYASILMAGIASMVLNMAVFNFPLEFAPENRRPSYLGLKSLWDVPFIAVPWIGGWLADNCSYTIVFSLGIMFAVLALSLYIWYVPDPRHRKSTT